MPAYAVAAGPPVPARSPRASTWSQAAALPETFFTVWHNVFQRGRLVAGESILIHGGASGIGTTAIQLAKAFSARGSSPLRADRERVNACAELGCDRAIDYQPRISSPVIKAATGGKGVDVVLDMVGGDYLPRNIECLAVEGRHVSIATLRGTEGRGRLPADDGASA